LNLSCHIESIIKQQSQRGEVGAAVDATRSVLIWVKRASQARAKVQASLEEAAYSELQRRGDIDRGIPVGDIPGGETPGFPSTWRPEVAPEDAPEDAVNTGVGKEVGLSELAWKLQEEVDRLRLGKRSVEEHVKQCLIEAADREDELGKLFKER